MPILLSHAHISTTRSISQSVGLGELRRDKVQCRWPPQFDYNSTSFFLFRNGTSRHEVNCLTKEEFERWSRSPALARQGSQIQSPLSSSSNAHDAIKAEVGNGGGGGATNGSSLDAAARQRAQTERDNKAMALMVQPSIDYGKRTDRQKERARPLHWK